MDILERARPASTVEPSYDPISFRRSDMASLTAARLGRDLDVLRAEWLNPGHPAATRHCTIDDLLPEEKARAIAGACDQSVGSFTRYKSFRERGTGSSRFEELPPILGEIAFALRAREVVYAVEWITGMGDLLADFTAYAAGVTSMGTGDFLNPHIDNSHNGPRTLYRRINLLYYPNPRWKTGDGGELELWDQTVRTRRCIPPRFNRLVLMETNRTSWHSVSPVLRGPRRCVSSYFFSENSPDGSDYHHVTSFTGRPGQWVKRMWGATDNRARQMARGLGMHRTT